MHGQDKKIRNVRIQFDSYLQLTAMDRLAGKNLKSDYSRTEKTSYKTERQKINRERRSPGFAFSDVLINIRTDRAFSRETSGLRAHPPVLDIVHQLPVQHNGGAEDQGFGDSQ